jgi:hypothetical protein
MEKPFNEFGGWLRFFWITNLLIFITTSLVFIMNCLSYALRENVVLCAGFIMLQLGFFLDAVFAFKILQYLKERNPANPNKILLLLFASMLISLPGLCFIESMPFEIIKPSSNSIISITQQGMYLLVWSMYFRESKRVKTFYGENAMPPKIKWLKKKTAVPDDSQSSEQQKV